MKRLYYLLPILLIAFALQACKSSKEAVSPKDTVSEAPADASEIATEEGTVASDETTDRSLFASIRRSPCFGRCPSYEMTIYSDGSVELDGRQNIDFIGKFTTTISKEKMDAIVDLANEIGFFEFKDEYDDPMVMDIPSTTTKVKGSNGEVKSVMRRVGFPTSLPGLEKLIESLLQSEKWLDESGEVFPPER